MINIPTKESSIDVVSKLRKDSEGNPTMYVILDSHDYLITEINITTLLAQSMTAPFLSSIPSCVICNDKIKFINRYYVDVNLKRSPESKYCVCQECLKKTKTQLSRIKKESPKDLPLYINDSNIFIKEYAIKILRKETKC